MEDIYRKILCAKGSNNPREPQSTARGSSATGTGLSGEALHQAREVAGLACPRTSGDVAPQFCLRTPR